MNNISIMNVRISAHKDGSVVTSKEISTGMFACFKGGELVRKNTSTTFLNYYFNAYGKVAEKVLKMNLRNGSYVNISGEFSTRPSPNSGVIIQIEVQNIEFSYSGNSINKTENDSPVVTTFQQETTQDVSIKNKILSPSIDLDKNDIFASIDTLNPIFN